jgi:hypothetical protein
VKGHHHLEAAGLNLQKVELLDSLTKRAAADLLNNTDAVVGVNDLVAYVENRFRADHEKYPEMNCVKNAGNWGVTRCYYT